MFCECKSIRFGISHSCSFTQNTKQTVYCIVLDIYTILKMQNTWPESFLKMTKQPLCCLWLPPPSCKMSPDWIPKLRENQRIVTSLWLCQELVRNFNRLITIKAVHLSRPINYKQSWSKAFPEISSYLKGYTTFPMD